MSLSAGRLSRLGAFVAFACHLATPGLASAAVSSLTVPIVLSSSGLAGAFYTSELSLTNRGTTTATIRFTYTAAFGGGGGAATDTLTAGRQKTVPDAIQYLISLGLPIPASGNRGGVLRLDFTDLSSEDAGSATVRTTTAVNGGRAGLAYSAFARGIGLTSYLCGLRQNTTDRSNVALINAGAAGLGDVVLRLTVASGDPASPQVRVLPDLTLAPGGFRQYTEILKEVGLDRGYVKIERVSGGAPYYAYATVLDQVTSDGSFVPALREEDIWGPPALTLPVVVETSAFTTEVVLCNVSTAPATVRLSYVADAIQTADSTASISVALGAGEQRVIPSFVQFLRSQGVAGVAAPGPTFAGALYLTVTGQDQGGVFLGGRTQTAGGGGRYGLFYTALANGTTATSAAWLYGLQQNAENRTNLAIVNTGETDASTLDLHVDLYDGGTGAIARSFDVSLAAKKWTQINTVLSPGIANGYAKITRTKGTNPFLAYGVVVDGGSPQTRSDDGAFVILEVQEPPASPELLAIRKVEAKARTLLTLAEGISPLEYVRQIAAFMATLPEYDFTGVEEKYLIAYGVFKNGRLHVVGHNRELGTEQLQVAAAGGKKTLAMPELPGSGYARVVQSFGPRAWAQSPVYALQSMLETPGGYAIRPGMNGDARLPVLRTISGDGYFYINAHGGPTHRTRDMSGPRVFSIQSSSLATPGSELLPDNVTDFAAQRLTYHTEINFDQGIDLTTGKVFDDVDTRYGITSDFVKAYWHFAPDSIVILNACFSGFTGDVAGAQNFIQEALNNHAGVVFGWTDFAHDNPSYKTAQYFTDRLIGANKFMKESPDQRAFPWELAYTDTASKNLTHDGASGAEFIPFPGTNDSILLDPSIKELQVNERDEKLVLVGYFGTTKGKVFVDRHELAGCTWGAEKIECSLPRTGLGSNGDVHAEVEGGRGLPRKSNIHQLTEWAIPIHYLWNDYPDKDLKIEGTGSIRFRGDIGSYRLTPGGTPQMPFRSMLPTQDSKLPLTASGVHAAGDCTEMLTGSATFVAETAPAGGAILATAAKVDASNPHLGAVGLAFGVSAGSPFQLVISGAPKCTGSFPIAPSFGLLGGAQQFPSPAPGYPDIPLTAIPLTWDSNWVIPATKFIDIGLGGELTIEWTTVNPNPLVRTDLAR